MKRHQIERFKVDSSNIASIGYDGGILVVEFTNGHLYAYAVDQATFEAFAAAESKGRHFNQQIRGKVSGEKLTSRCGKCGSEPEIVGDPCSDCGAKILPLDTIHKER